MEQSIWWDAYKAGYELGIEYGKQYFANKKRKISINYEPSYEAYKMEWLNGKLINLGGRTLPF